MELVFVGHRCCDHSPSSGYDQLCSLFSGAGWMDGRPLERGEIAWFRKPRPVAGGPQVFHVLYGDCSGKGLPEILRRRSPGAVIVSSAHQPVSRLRSDAPGLAALRQSDAIVAVSEVQARELAQLGLAVPVFAVPHGIWTHAFRPTPAKAPARSGATEVLIVGSFHRDWEGARQVAGSLARAGVRSIAVGAGAREHLRDAEVDVLERVSEEELAALYRRAAAVFLPFVDATASNALLEAMAAGCPAVCPRLPSLFEEYLGDDVDCFERGRYGLAARKLIRYVREPAEREARSRELRARAERFDWSRLRERYRGVYDKVVSSSVVPSHGPWESSPP